MFTGTNEMRNTRGQLTVSLLLLWVTTPPGQAEEYLGCYHDICYYREDVATGFDMARRMCEHKGRTLLTVETGAVHNNLKHMHRANPFKDRTIWLGMIRQDSTEGAPRCPMKGLHMEATDAPCHEKKWYLCTAKSTDVNRSCSWNSSDGICYFNGGTKLTWYEAFRYCSQEGGVLMSRGSAEMRDMEMGRRRAKRDVGLESMDMLQWETAIRSASGLVKGRAGISLLDRDVSNRRIKRSFGSDPDRIDEKDVEEIGSDKVLRRRRGAPSGNPAPRRRGDGRRSPGGKGKDYRRPDWGKGGPPRPFQPPPGLAGKGKGKGKGLGQDKPEQIPDITTLPVVLPHQRRLETHGQRRESSGEDPASPVVDNPRPSPPTMDPLKPFPTPGPGAPREFDPNELPRPAEPAPCNPMAWFFEHYLWFDDGFYTNWRFKWENGKPVEFTNWAHTQPGIWYNGVCAVISGTTGKWKLQACLDRAGVICQGPESPVPPQNPIGPRPRPLPHQEITNVPDVGDKIQRNAIIPRGPSQTPTSTESPVTMPTVPMEPDPATSHSDNFNYLALYIGVGAGLVILTIFGTTCAVLACNRNKPQKQIEKLAKSVKALQMAQMQSKQSSYVGLDGHSGSSSSPYDDLDSNYFSVGSSGTYLEAVRENPINQVYVHGGSMTGKRKSSGSAKALGIDSRLQLPNMSEDGSMDAYTYPHSGRSTMRMSTRSGESGHSSSPTYLELLEDNMQPSPPPCRGPNQNYSRSISSPAHFNEDRVQSYITSLARLRSKSDSDDNAMVENELYKDR